MVECTREWARVLKPSGSMFVNLGDKYSTGTSGDRNNGFNERSGNAPGARVQERSQIRSAAVRGVPPKSLLLLPERYRIACVDELGLIARAVLVWSKPNGLPESVTDRVRRSHEDWVHLVKQPRYFAAVDEIREPQDSIGQRHEGRSGY
ncbi:MAG TPA: DNA methyltransferase, partial [Streptosporangiaceae bacterium]